MAAIELLTWRSGRSGAERGAEGGIRLSSKIGNPEHERPKFGGSPLPSEYQSLTVVGIPRLAGQPPQTIRLRHEGRLAKAARPASLSRLVSLECAPRAAELSEATRRLDEVVDGLVTALNAEGLS
jgi:hypothetical protein